MTAEKKIAAHVRVTRHVAVNHAIADWQTKV